MQTPAAQVPFFNLPRLHRELAARGVEVTEVFHPSAPGDQFRPGASGHLGGRSADSYSSFASFTDPDGNGWLLQEIKARLPGR